MRFLLVGANGQVGRELHNAANPLGTVVATERSSLDLADLDAIRRVVREVRPDIILNAAAYTAVDKAESEPPAAMLVNGLAPGVMAEEAKRLGALLVHYSTDYVFDGLKSAPYTEEDATRPLGVYGRTKLEGEQRIRAVGCRHLLLRTSWVYGPRGSNFYLTIARKAASGDRLRVVADQRGVPTSSAFLAEYTLALIHVGAEGLLNLVPCGDTTWFEFARQIVRATGSASDVEPITTGQYPTPARRPAYSVLSNAKAVAVLGNRLPDWKSVFDQMRESAPL